MLFSCLGGEARVDGVFGRQSCIDSDLNLGVHFGDRLGGVNL